MPVSAGTVGLTELFHPKMGDSPLSERLCCLVLNGEAVPMDRDFKNEVFFSYEPNPAPSCGACRAKPALVLKMLNPQSGKTVRMFKCVCGEQTWTENKP
jgi:hypothetical protein